MKSIFNSHNILLKALLALALSFVSVHAWGGSSSTYYAKLKVSVPENDNRKGRVYASTSKEEPDDSVYSKSSESDSQGDTNPEKDMTFYAFAKPQGGYIFYSYTDFKNATQDNDDANKFIVKTSSTADGTNTGEVSVEFLVNPDKYKIIFSDDGVNIDVWEYDVEDNRNLPEPQKRDAYTFTSWIPQSEPEGETDFFSYGWKTHRTYSADSTLLHKFGNVTLVAQWEPISYHIIYQDDKSGTGTLSPTTYNTESTEVLPTLTKNGYKFKGWKPSCSEGNWVSAQTYSGGTSLKEKHGDVNLVAQWEETEYDISYDPKGGIGTLSPETYTISSIDTLPSLEKKDYTFNGWTVTDVVKADYDDDLTDCGWTVGAVVTGSLNEKFGHVSLEAKWVPKEYKIILDLADGTFEGGATTPTTYYYNIEGNGDGNISNLPKVVKTGYDFKGWKVTNTDEDSWWKGHTPSDEDNGMSVVGKWGKVNLTAQWTPHPYTITLNPDGGKLSGGATDETKSYNYNIEGNGDRNISTLPKVEKTGYSFAGWKVTSTGTSGWSSHSPSVGDNGMSVVGKWGDVTLTAQWEAIPGYIKISVPGLQKNDSAVFEISYDSVSFVVSLDSSNASGLLVKIPDVGGGKNVTVTPKAWPKNYDKRETDAVTGEVKTTHEKSDPLVFGFTMDERTSNIFETSREF